MFLKYSVSVECKDAPLLDDDDSVNTPAIFTPVSIVVQVINKTKLTKKESENLVEEMEEHVTQLIRKDQRPYRFKINLGDLKQNAVECEKQDAHLKAVFAEHESVKVTPTKKNIELVKTRQERYLYEYYPTLYIESTTEQHSPPKKTNIVIDTLNFVMNNRAFETIGHGIRPLIQVLLDSHGLIYDEDELIGETQTRKNLTLCKENKKPHITVADDNEKREWVVRLTGHPIKFTTVDEPKKEC